LAESASTWGRFSMRWPGRRNVRFSKDICGRIMSPCASRFLRNTGGLVIGFRKGKSAIAVARLCGRERKFTGEHLWARGYAVSTVGFELEQIRQYIRDQEEADGAGRF
jgi:hypothetical protein